MEIKHTISRIFQPLQRKGEQGALLANVFIGGAIAFFVYFIDQSGLIEIILNKILYLLLLTISSLLRYNRYHVLSISGIAVDATIILLAAVLWTYLRSVSARILANFALCIILLPTSLILFNRFNILSNGVPIVLGIILAILIESVRDLIKNRVRRKLAAQKQEAEYSVIRHLAHNVKPNLQIAKSPLVALKEYLAINGALGLELSRRLDGSSETIGEALENAIGTLGQINSIIDTTRDLVTMDISSEEFRETNLKELLENDIFPLYSTRFRLRATGVSVSTRLHRASFVEAINNLLRNAAVHGFPEEAPDAEVCFNIRQTRKNVVIDYTNNGKPFPPNLTAADFLTFGRKSIDSPGEGLGGAWIGKVIEAHGGTFEIIRDELPVHFRISIPKGGR